MVNDLTHRPKSVYAIVVMNSLRYEILKKLFGWNTDVRVIKEGQSVHGSRFERIIFFDDEFYRIDEKWKESLKCRFPSGDHKFEVI